MIFMNIWNSSNSKIWNHSVKRLVSIGDIRPRLFKLLQGHAVNGHEERPSVDCISFQARYNQQCSDTSCYL